MVQIHAVDRDQNSAAQLQYTMLGNRMNTFSMNRTSGVLKLIRRLGENEKPYLLKFTAKDRGMSRRGDEVADVTFIFALQGAVILE